MVVMVVLEQHHLYQVQASHMLVAVVVVLLVLEPQARVGLAVEEMLEHLTALQMAHLQPSTQVEAAAAVVMALGY
jgi:hypothetical protein